MIAEVLKEENGEDRLAGRRLEQALFVEALEHDRRRRHGQHQARRERRLPRPAQRQRGEAEDGRGRYDLQAAEAENGAAQRPELRRLELEPDDEQHDDDAELGEVHDMGALGSDDAEHGRPDDDAGDEIAEDGAQAEARGDRHREHGGGQVGESAQEEFVEGHRLSRPARPAWHSRRPEGFGDRPCRRAGLRAARDRRPISAIRSARDMRRPE